MTVLILMATMAIVLSVGIFVRHALDFSDQIDAILGDLFKGADEPEG